MPIKKIGNFIMLQRSVQTLELIEHQPRSFLLLALIALRAKRTNNHPDRNLQIGEAYIGDYRAYGATRAKYRRDIKCLEISQKITTRKTNRGTIAKMSASDIFDINSENIAIKKTKKEPTNDQQKATNNNDKNEKNDKVGSSSIGFDSPLPKPDLLSERSWLGACSLYQVRLEKLGESIGDTKKRVLFEELMFQSANQNGEHTYLASVFTDFQLKKKISTFERSIPEPYLIEAQKRGML
jgi:hypothetical protein